MLKVCKTLSGQKSHLMELKNLVVSGKGTFESVSAVEELCALHIERGTVWEEKDRDFTFN